MIHTCCSSWITEPEWEGNCCGTSIYGTDERHWPPRQSGSKAVIWVARDTAKHGLDTTISESTQFAAARTKHLVAAHVRARCLRKCLGLLKQTREDVPESSHLLGFWVPASTLLERDLPRQSVFVPLLSPWRVPCPPTWSGSFPRAWSIHLTNAEAKQLQIIRSDGEAGNRWMGGRKS